MGRRQMKRIDIFGTVKIERTEWVDRVSNKEVLPKIKENKRILDKMLKRKGNWTGLLIMIILMAQRGGERKEQTEIG